jgi:hypothetical protein
MRENFARSLEQWRPIPGHPGYEASSTGEVRSLKRGRVKVLRAHLSRGYLSVTLCLNGKIKTGLVNRLVCMAFHGEPPFNGAQAAHGDGCRTNNVPSNLSWKTCKANHADRIRHGTNPAGERNGRATLDPSAVAFIKQNYVRGTGRQNPGNSAELARQFGVSQGAIWHVIKGETWANMEHVA